MPARTLTPAVHSNDMETIGEYSSAKETELESDIFKQQEDEERQKSTNTRATTAAIRN